jgi:hypothetical protein
MSGKGDARRPANVTKEEFIANWERVFGKTPDSKHVLETLAKWENRVGDNSLMSLLESEPCKPISGSLD